MVDFLSLYQRVFPQEGFLKAFPYIWPRLGPGQSAGMGPRTIPQGFWKTSYGQERLP